MHKYGCLHSRKQPKSCLLADERQTVIVTTAAQDKILETVRVAIRIRLRKDIASFFQQCRTQLVEVRFLRKTQDHKKLHILFASRKFRKGAKDTFIQGSESVILKKHN